MKLLMMLQKMEANAILTSIINPKQEQTEFMKHLKKIEMTFDFIMNIQGDEPEIDIRYQKIT